MIYLKFCKKNYYHVFFFCCLTLIISATFFVGAVPTHIYGHDIFFFLDNGWRILNGQSPHVDFTSAWGPVTFLIVALGLTISGGTVDGIGYGSALYGLIIGLWSYYLCGNRMIPIIRTLLCLYLVCLIVAPFPIGINFKMSSHAMLYNRYGYALLALILIETLCFEQYHKNNKRMLIFGISSGLASAITLFLKISYFSGSIILILYSILSKKFSRPYFLGLFSGFSIGSIILLSFIDFRIIAMVNDLKMAIGARSNSIFLNIIITKFIYNSPIFIFIILIGIQTTNTVQLNFKPSNYNTLYYSIIVICVDFAIISSNQQSFTLPLSLIFSILIANITIISYQNFYKNENTSFFNNIYYLRLIIPEIIFFIIYFLLDLAGLCYAVHQKFQFTVLHPTIQFTERRISSLLFFDNDKKARSNGQLYAEYLNDGLYLISNNSNFEDSILTMEMFNPFSYALGRKPAKGGISAAAYNYTISNQHHPSENKFLGTAEIVMVPIQSATPSIYYDGFYKIYNTAINKRYNLIAKSKFWFLYRKNESYN